MRRKKRKRLDSDNLEEDEEFIPGGDDEEMLEDMEEEETEEEEEETEDLDREEHYSNWVFPEWVPSVNDWKVVPKSEVEKYLPQELQSAAFKVSREGLGNKETMLQRLNRFQVSDPHPQRLDMVMFVGGPVWALEWCPLPDGATGNQYLAVACHQGVNDQHVFNQTPEAGRASLAYSLGQEKGFVWQLKWCPAGAWEPPTCSRKAKEVLTLKLGAFKAPHHDKSGQVLSMDWLPDKPHNIMAIGFYDGTVGLWDLASCSSLLRVRDPSHGMTLLPYRCFVAHDNAVRALCFCPASRHVMVTGGNDRMVKLWDLKRLYEPISIQRRNLTTEVCWPLASPGTFQAQETTRGLHGAYYTDLGYRNARSVFITPRTATVWSLSFSDWCNSLVTSDGLGEVIFVLLPEFNCTHPSLRRTVERRFPIYFTDMVRYSAEEEREEGGEGCPGEGEKLSMNNNSKQAEEEPASSDEEERSREASAAMDHIPNMAPNIQTYQEAVKKYYLHYSDSDLRSFKNYKKRAPWKRMTQTELKTELDLDMMPLAALHKVRFNPNMSCHTWVASVGQAGLLRVHCLQNMTSSQITKQLEMIQFKRLLGMISAAVAVQGLLRGRLMQRWLNAFNIYSRQEDPATFPYRAGSALSSVTLGLGKGGYHY
ncbi:unnamed protein product [Merluccius merluccius]